MESFFCVVKEYFQKKLIMVEYCLEELKMNHILRLKSKYFDYINKGTKKIEIRLFDEKRQKIEIGDTIIFKNEENEEATIQAKVLELLRYKTFEELLNDFSIDILADKSITKQQLLNILYEFYTPEEVRKYGVIGIRIEKI